MHIIFLPLGRSYALIDSDVRNCETREAFPTPLAPTMATRKLVGGSVGDGGVGGCGVKLGRGLRLGLPGVKLGLGLRFGLGV